MLNVFDVADLLVERIKSAYPDDVAIVAYYGSYAQGTATRRSDLDFVFIPATSAGHGASLQFIVDDISFDFWPISWERAERMASFQEPTTSIIADCRLLHARSDEDRERFLRLRNGIASLQEPEYARQFADMAESRLRGAYVHLYKLIRARDSERESHLRANGVDIRRFRSLGQFAAFLRARE
ncbi:nucleotidyltransferase domain-containing protein [Paenibacillus glycinis]|uniref:nucleotidyltransferase domain-containing protein n=1 Tax=Paenibacillus glycinis TaxID=2697035 RepID=UPI001F24663F|nr:nucleotidyltransferase domain-containing protein [Paenibacillus glycinis]